MTTPFKLRSGNNLGGRNGKGVAFKKMGGSPVRQKDYEEYYGTYAEHKADMEAAGVEPLDIKTWTDLNVENMPSGKDTKKGYNPEKMYWHGRRIAEREKIDPEYAEKARKFEEEGLPDELIESLEHKGVDTELLTDE